MIRSKFVGLYTVYQPIEKSLESSIVHWKCLRLATVPEHFSLRFIYYWPFSFLFQIIIMNCYNHKFLFVQSITAINKQPLKAKSYLRRILFWNSLYPQDTHIIFIYHRSVRFIYTYSFFFGSSFFILITWHSDSHVALFLIAKTYIYFFFVNACYFIIKWNYCSVMALTQSTSGLKF